MCSSCRFNCDSAAGRQRAGAPSWSAEDLNPCHPGQGWGTSPPQICTCQSQMVTWGAFYCHFLRQKFHKPVCLLICRRCINSLDRLSCPVEFRHLLKNTHRIQSARTCSCEPICWCVCVTSTPLCTRGGGRPASAAMLAAWLDWQMPSFSWYRNTNSSPSTAVSKVYTHMYKIPPNTHTHYFNEVE